MSEHPILFSTEMVRAILASRKTQTRRVIKPQPPRNVDDLEINYACEIKELEEWWIGTDESWRSCFVYKCPYGVPGDTLWVRETFCVAPGNSGKPSLFYRANPDENKYISGLGHAWKPSIFMPRGYSRITLNVNNVRVERVQGISRADQRS